MSERALTLTVVASVAAQAPRLEAARAIYSQLEAVETSLRRDRDQMLLLGWQLGEILTAMKEEIGHGRWLPYLAGHWPQLGERTAQRCMEFFRSNPKSAESAVLDYTTESRRKFLWHTIPEKERPQLEGDGPVAPVSHHLTIINHFSKWDRQLSLGLNGAPPPVEQMRRDFEPMIKRQVALLGKDWLLELIAHADARG